MQGDLRRVEAKVEVSYTDPFLDQTIEVSASERANVSYPEQTADSVMVPMHKWLSLDGSCVLDGTYHLAPEPEDLSRYQMGWWGSQLAGADGSFSPPYPTLTVTHQARPVHTLRVVGDAARGEYPVDFRIDLYGPDGTLLYSETVTGNTVVEWSKPLSNPVLDVTRQVLTITRWSHPGRQVKVLEFFTSIQETYLSSDIVELRLLEEREASQGSLPVGNISANELSLRLINEGGKFDPTNPQSPLWGLLKPNRRIRAWLGVAGEGPGQNLQYTWDDMSDWEVGTADRTDTASTPGAVVLETQDDGLDSDGEVASPGSLAYYQSGTWTSQPIDLSSVGQAAASVISWQADTPPGTSITVEVSLDGGQTWQPCANGSEIPGILPGMDLSGKHLLVRATLSTSDTAVTPVLHSLTVEVVHEEWVPLGVYWSLDWDTPDDTLEATVIARDRLELLRKSTYEPGEVQQNVSLYTLAEQVLRDAGLQPGEYWIDPALQQTVIPWAWLQPMSHREALRTIAEAGLAVVYADRDGVVRIETLGGVPATPVAEITEDDYFPPLQAPSKQESVANEIVVTTQPLRPADEPQEVYRSTTPIHIPAGRTVTVTAKYSQPPVIEAQVALAPPEQTVEPGEPSEEPLDEPSEEPVVEPLLNVAIMGAAFYAWGAEVTIMNYGDVPVDVVLVITGRPLSVQGGVQVIARDPVSILENGVLRYEFPDNPLIQTYEQAQAIATALLASAKDPRRDIEVEWRGNPAMELGDRVTVAGQDVHIIRQELTWAGALSARLIGRKVT